MADLETRRLTDAEVAAGDALSDEAFGETSTPSEHVPPGRHPWGTFAGDRLVVQVEALELASWFSGTAVSTTGVAGVTVAAEDRGAGRLDAPMRAALADGAGRGDVIATLYPTAPGIYRRFGFEVVGSLVVRELATATLPTARVPGVSLRRATEDDAEVVRSAYDAWAREQDGPLTRRTPTFGSPVGDAQVTLAEVDDRVVGFLRWHRGRGYDATSVLTVDDLIATEPRAAAALWAFLAGWAPVAPTVRLRTSGADATMLALRAGAGRVVAEWPYMLRVGDVPGAVGLRSAVVDGTAVLGVAGDALRDPAGYRLTAANKRVTVEADELRTDVPVLEGRGLALWYAGTQTCAALRSAGLLTGPDHHDRFLDRVLERRPFHIRNYF